ncbi:uncharacterized protein DNG_10483 [Cephalotrichum gorgonifer]|uniref:Uncharacterized protein n=1 Tax=Cephalotrichum gorgonifer TaxID=2041049 RepID=A0AAE8N921_9PEZI|nr:uncharacterized protein DNG_10483 [Cephalotrichum gorgonifer]
MCPRSSFVRAVGLLYTIALASASPVPQDVIVIGESTIPAHQTTEQICAATYDSPSEVWANSGAGVFLAKFLAENTEDNWANKIDQQTTDGGSQGVSNLACTDLLAGNCRAPTVQCQFYTPPELFHIRNAMNNAHRMMTGLHEALQNAAIVEGLFLDQLISDFGPPSEPNVNGILSGAFTIAAGAAAALPVIAGPLTIIAGIFGTLGSVGGPSEDPSLALQAQLSKAFTDADDNLQALARAVFGGVNTDIIPNLSGSTAASPVSRFFAEGRFLIKVTPEGSVDAITDITDGDTCASSQGAGSRWINNECFQVHSFSRHNPNEPGVTTPIEAEKILKFDDGSGYNFVVEDFYINANECANSHPNFDGELTASTPTLGISEHKYPECFFNLPVIKAAKTPCNFGEKGKLPGNLGISDSQCSRVNVCLGNPAPGCISP